MEEAELIIFLSEFKLELLAYLEEKAKLIPHCPTSHKLYNILTFEVINILKLLLQFGLFNKKPPKKKNGVRERLSTMVSIFDRKVDEESTTTDIEKLINYLAALLEYDE